MTVPLSTSSIRSSPEACLEARDHRQSVLSRAFGQAPLILGIALNIPGACKAPAGTAALFAAARQRVESELSPLQLLFSGSDPLGPFAVFGLAGEAESIKRRCVALESELPAFRLVDLDVYDRRGLQVGRQQLGLPPRPCLLCAQAAVDCMRAVRHPAADVLARVDELLAPYVLP